MRRIFKYWVRMNDQPNEVTLDEGITVLHVEMDYDSAMLEDVVAFWAIHDDDAPECQRRFQIVGTGHPLPAGAEHRGTVKASPFVWHLVELPTTTA